MINKILIVLFFCFTNNFIFFELKSQIKNNIVVKVGNSLISSIDIQNEIITSIIINKQKITQTNIDNYKNYAIKKLIKSTIKRNEIEKYDVKNYDPIALNNYIDNVAKNLNTNKVGLKKIFTETGINYDLFVNNHRTELLWNTLIFQIYNNQININIIEVENEIEKIKEKKSLDELKKIKKTILLKRKEEKLDLFSRSHFSNLENLVSIDFQ
jgi:hypothetical protein